MYAYIIRRLLSIIEWICKTPRESGENFTDHQSTEEVLHTHIGQSTKAIRDIGFFVSLEFMMYLCSVLTMDPNNRRLEVVETTNE
jgi:hypothetical protein